MRDNIQAADRRRDGRFAIVLTVPTMGEKLRDYRKRAVLTQEELAERSGVGVATIIRIERGQIDEPRVSTVRKLAGPLEVEPRDLIGD